MPADEVTLAALQVLVTAAWADYEVTAEVTLGGGGVFHGLYCRGMRGQNIVMANSAKNCLSNEMCTYISTRANIINLGNFDCVHYLQNAVRFIT